MAEEHIVCEVAYARPERQWVFNVTLRSGATAMDALAEALKLGLHQRCPEVDAQTAVLGVFGRVVPPQHPLKDGDRVEIYRPLTADPRIARRARVKAKR